MCCSQHKRMASCDVCLVLSIAAGPTSLLLTAELVLPVDSCCDAERCAETATHMLMVMFVMCVLSPIYILSYLYA